MNIFGAIRSGLYHPRAKAKDSGTAVPSGGLDCEMPKRNDPEYPRMVLCYKRSRVDFSNQDSSSQAPANQAQANQAQANQAPANQAQANQAQANQAQANQAQANQAQANQAQANQAQANRVDILNTLKNEIGTCRLLICEWSDSDQVVADCETLLTSAQNSLNTAGNLLEVTKLIAANDELLKVRERLVQAWHSLNSEVEASCLMVWQVGLLIVFGWMLWHFQLLPGQTPKVASSNITAAILFSSFIFGAIGGLFDGISALSKHCTGRKFDPGYWLWYVVNFILGGILGVVAYAAIFAGLVSAYGGTASTVSNNVSSNISSIANSNISSAAGNATPLAAITVLVVAFIAGVKQIKVLNLLERIANGVFGEDAKDSTSKTSS